MLQTLSLICILLAFICSTALATDGREVGGFKLDNIRLNGTFTVALDERSGALSVGGSSFGLSVSARPAAAANADTGTARTKPSTHQPKHRLNQRHRPTSSRLGTTNTKTWKKGEHFVMPVPDNDVKIWTIPIGQGSAHVLQCPHTDSMTDDFMTDDFMGQEIAIFDLGSSTGSDSGGRVTDEAVGAFLDLGYNFVSNIFISHCDNDHHNILAKFAEDIARHNSNVKTFIGGNHYHYENTAIARHLLDHGALATKSYSFSNGKKCFGNGCDDPWEICSGRVKVRVLFANWGDNPNSNSMVVKIEYGSLSALFTGDFQLPDHEMQNLLNSLDEQGLSVQSTLFMISHHGADNQKGANSQIFLDRVKPYVAVVSAPYPKASYWHPRCATLERVKKSPNLMLRDKDDGPLYCGDGSQAQVFRHDGKDIHTTFFGDGDDLQFVCVSFQAPNAVGVTLFRQATEINLY